MLEAERRREKAELWRMRWLATQVINISGRMVKFELRPEQIFKFEDEIEMLTEEERDKRGKEILKALKKKFWTKINPGKNLDGIKFYGEN